MPAAIDDLVLVHRGARWVFGRVVAAGPPAIARLVLDDDSAVQVTLKDSEYSPARFPLAAPPPSRESAEQTRHDASGASPLDITDAEARKLVAAYSEQVARLDAQGRGGELDLVRALGQLRRRGGRATDQSAQSAETPEARLVPGMTRRQYEQVMDARAKMQVNAAAQRFIVPSLTPATDKTAPFRLERCRARSSANASD